MRPLNATFHMTTAPMRTIGAIFLLAILAIGVSIYTDDIFTSSQVRPRHPQSTVSVGLLGDLKF